MTAPRKVAAVVTTFQGGEFFLPHLERIAEQVAVVVIVDDSGDPSRKGILSFRGMEKAIVLHNEENLGIAAALNRGIAQAGAEGCDWIHKASPSWAHQPRATCFCSTVGSPRAMWNAWGR